LQEGQLHFEAVLERMCIITSFHTRQQRQLLHAINIQWHIAQGRVEALDRRQRQASEGDTVGGPQQYHAFELVPAQQCVGLRRYRTGINVAGVRHD
jgi:hypothetical protein